MGIYITIKPCGCEITSGLGYDWDDTCIPCVAHGGNPVIVAGRQARRWAGPENPYANPEEICEQLACIIELPVDCESGMVRAIRIDDRDGASVCEARDAGLT